MATDLPNNIDEIKAGVDTSAPACNCASFWAYISPSNNTAKYVTQWEVVIQQQGGNWQGTITSANPQQQLHAPSGVFGQFNVTVTASGPGMPEHKLTPQSGSKPNIGVSADCYGMVGIVSNQDGTDANYWTVWDAFCYN